MARAKRCRVVIGIMMAASGLLVVGAAGAQTETPSAPSDASGGVKETFGAPAELQETAAYVDRLLRERRFAEARAICEQAYDAAGDDATRALALRGIGETYKEEYLMDKAIEVFQQVIRRYPASDQASWAWIGIAESYTYKAQVSHPERNIALALPILAQFVQDYPHHERAERALKFRGWCFQQLGDDLAALAEYEKAVDLYPKHRHADGCLMRVIELQQKLGRWDDAIASARRYLELYPDRAPAAAQLTLGYSYAAKGDVAQALQEFERVPGHYPAHAGHCAMALFQKGLLEKASGQLAASRTTLERVAEQYPTDYLAAQARRELELMGAH